MFVYPGKLTCIPCRLLGNIVNMSSKKTISVIVIHVHAKLPLTLEVQMNAANLHWKIEITPKGLMSIQN